MNICVWLVYLMRYRLTAFAFFTTRRRPSLGFHGNATTTSLLLLLRQMYEGITCRPIHQPIALAGWTGCGGSNQLRKLAVVPIIASEDIGSLSAVWNCLES